jgi:type IV pilus assembly protein PilE
MIEVASREERYLIDNRSCLAHRPFTACTVPPAPLSGPVAYTNSRNYQKDVTDDRPLMDGNVMASKVKKQAGFTLIELVIVMVIVAILAAIAYPWYTQFVVRSRRAAAEAYMLEVASRQERFRLDTRSYAANMTALSLTAPQEVSPYYTVTTAQDTSRTPNGFSVTATRNTTTQDDPKCGDLTYNDLGNKTANGTMGSDLTYCWRQ